MADVQNQGGVQQGGQKKKPEGNKCPQCNIRPVAKDREACLVCQPILEIRAKLGKGSGQWQVAVQTYKNRAQESTPFLYQIEGEDAVIVKANDPGWAHTGLFIINIPFAEKKKSVSFDVLIGKADVDDPLVIPKTNPTFKKSKPRTGKGFKNFWR